MIPTLTTLIVGVIIGYMGQRSKFCIITGIRDCFLIKDFYRIKGLAGLILGAVFGFIIFKSMGGVVPNFPTGMPKIPTEYLILSIIGGIGMGFYSVLAEGCPFRQHVMAAQGSQSAMFYLLGFYLGIIYFYVVTVKWLELLFTVTS